MAQKNAQPVATTEHIPSSEQHAKGFPPFDATTFPSQLLWLVLTFVALYLLMARVALPRVGAIIESRQKRIAGDLADAQGFKDKSDAAIAAYEKALADARGRAQGLANEAREKHAAAAEADRKALDAKLNAHIAESEKTIAASREAAMANVRNIATDATAAIVERLTGSAPAASDVSAAVGNVLKR
jgi:F-type H+-transporting ATPase subunit b